MAVNPWISEVLFRKNLGTASRQAGLWIMVNLFTALFLAMEMYYGSYLAVVLLELPASLIWKLEMTALVVSCLNLSVHLSRYLYPARGCSTLNLTSAQQKLLTVSKNDPGIVTTPKGARGSAGRSASTPMDLSALSWLSQSEDQTGDRSRLGLSTTASSWTYQEGSGSTPGGPCWAGAGSGSPSPYPYPQRFLSPPAGSPVSRHAPSHSTPTNTSGPLRVSTPVNRPDVNVTDLDSLREYLSQYDEQEKRFSAVNASLEASANKSQSFWNDGKFSLMDFFSSSPHKHVYQLSIRAPSDEPAGGAAGGQKLDGSLATTADPTWARLGVDRDTLFRWTENLRVWLCKTIFVRLVKEVDSVNAALKRHGLSEVQIGEVGLDKLRKTSQLIHDVPSLNAVLHFLSVSTHQEYLLHRIRELSRGGCLQEFRWNGGGTFRNKPWEEHLPTDSAIVMHMVSAYLDARLPPHPTHPDGRTFTNEHVSRAPDTPPSGSDRLVVHQAEITPPRFTLASGADTYELAKGRNNLFHTLLLFVYMVRERHGSMLDKIHAGPTGLNMLWVIES